MSTTVLDALLNAQASFETAKQLPQIFPLAMDQLNNAIEAIENGKGANDVIQDNMLGEVDTG